MDITIPDALSAEETYTLRLPGVESDEELDWLRTAISAWDSNLTNDQWVALAAIIAASDEDRWSYDLESSLVYAGDLIGWRGDEGPARWRAALDVLITEGCVTLEVRHRADMDTATKRRRYIDIIRRDGAERCTYCGAEPLRDRFLQIDHVHPRALGGTHDLHNLVLACAPCNQSKGAKPLSEWLDEAK